MSYGLAALSGLLSGLQGLPKGMNEGMQFDQRQQQIDLQRRQLEEGNSSDWGAITPVLKAGGMDVSTLPASGRVKDSLVPHLLSLSQKKAELAQASGERERLATTVEGLGRGTPATLGGALQPGEDPEAAAMIPRIPGQPGNARAALMAPLLRVKGGDAIAKALFPDHDKFISSDKPVLDTSTRTWIQPPRNENPASAFDPKAFPGYQPVPTQNAKGEVSTRWEPPPENRQRAEGALADVGWTPDMPGYREALHTAMYPPVPYNSGGGAVPRIFSVPRPPQSPAATLVNPPLPSPPGQQPTVQDAGKRLRGAADAANGLPGVPPAGTPQPGPTRLPGGGFQSPPNVPTAAQQDDIAGVDAALSGIQRLKGGIADPENQKVLGTPLKNLSGYMNRSKDYWLGTGLTDSQREFLATTAKEMQTIKKELIGASRTIAELKDLIPLVPDPYQDIGGQFAAKISAIEKGLEDIRRAKENAMRGSRVQPPPRLDPPDVKTAPSGGGADPREGTISNGGKGKYIWRGGQWQPR